MFGSCIIFSKGVTILINLMEIKRLVSYVASGLVSIMIIFAMIALQINPFIALLFGFIVSLVISFVSFIASGNALTRIVSGSEYGVMVLGSPGQIKIYTATVMGDKFVSFIDGEMVEQKFNRNLFWYVSKKIKQGILRQQEIKPGIDPTGKPVIRKGNEVVFEAPIEGDNISNEIFKTDFPFLLYNPSIKSFITKEWLFKQEYDSMFFNFGWELKQSIDLHNNQAGGITRKILDLIALKSRDPQGKKIVLIFIVIVVFVIALVTFGPMVFEFLDASMSDPSVAADLLEGNKLL